MNFIAHLTSDQDGELFAIFQRLPRPNGCIRPSIEAHHLPGVNWVYSSSTEEHRYSTLQLRTIICIIGLADSVPQAATDGVVISARRSHEVRAASICSDTRLNGGRRIDRVVRLPCRLGRKSTPGVRAQHRTNLSFTGSTP